MPVNSNNVTQAETYKSSDLTKKMPGRLNIHLSAGRSMTVFLVHNLPVSAQFANMPLSVVSNVAGLVLVV